MSKMAEVHIEGWGETYIVSARFGDLQVILPTTFIEYSDALKAMGREIQKEIIRYEINHRNGPCRKFNRDSL